MGGATWSGLRVHLLGTWLAVIASLADPRRDIERDIERESCLLKTLEPASACHEHLRVAHEARPPDEADTPSVGGSCCTTLLGDSAVGAPSGGASVSAINSTCTPQLFGIGAV